MTPFLGFLQKWPNLHEHQRLWGTPFNAGFTCVYEFIQHAFFEPPRSRLMAWLGVRALEPGCLDSQAVLPLAGYSWASV